ncbi:MAG: hypothetical protein NVSMB3_07180 [Acidobacteriaceae bacterium]
MLTDLRQRCPPPLVARALFTVASVAALFSRFFHHGLLLGFFQDDFFYYLKVAENLALHGISSFDGVHLTNGYHPLWLLTLTLLRWCLHGTAFFLALQTLTLAAALVCFSHATRIFRALQVAEPLLSIAAFIVSMQALLLLRYGMEVTLALPLCLWLLSSLLELSAAPTPLQLLWLGTLGALAVLARLDAILLVGTLFLALLWSRKNLRSPKTLLLLALGLWPLYLYLFVNFRIFHLLAPVSGLSKQLKSTWLPSLSSVRGLVLPMDRMKIIFILPCLALLAAALALTSRTLRLLPRVQAAILVSALAFPLLQTLVLSFVSDWNIWPWYFYSFVFSSIAAIALLAREAALAGQSTRRPLEALGLALCLAYVVYIATYSVLAPNSIGIYTSSRQLATYMDAHPGTYAMGDQAGITGYLSSQPVIQLEGLVMDREYLLKIKRREPLRQIMADYGVRFYVALSWQAPHPCLSLREPGQAGPSSTVSQGFICAQPLATFHRDNLPIYVFDAHAIQ